ncbi:MAG TPA: hypothetical protein VEG39_16850 [Clostridia bacterium]|nr:hypothetical protein [Clostridia bacterium]
MPDGLMVSNPDYQIKNINPDDAFELQLVRNDIISDILFLIGTFISISVNLEAEKEIVCPEETNTPAQDAAVVEDSRISRISIVILLFLAGTIIIAYTAYQRLNKQKAELNESSGQADINNIKGGELVITGLLLRIIGYIISFAGIRIRAENPV